MENLFVIISSIAAIAFWIGLLKPTWVGMPNRKKSSLFFILVLMLTGGVKAYLYPAQPFAEELGTHNVDNDKKPVLSSNNETKNIKRFSDITTMMADFNDYPPENGAFKILSTAPLTIQLSPRITVEDLQQPEYMIEGLQRAAVYGVYRTFIHTSNDSISVVVMPLLIDAKNKKQRFMNEYTLKVTSTRAKALTLAKKYSGVSTFDNLVKTDGYQWVDSFASCCYWNMKTSSHDEFFSELIKK
ncbi:hypothetical protein [Hafnia psychrotolerans]|uniref:Uncharacterized protein n=1 Tax=Hafnia psychrotolerans TaxID=1477018 RepID=A0ABQ1GEC6_9GAMM|nr:hypothetical protein [Hafnia psychrotolerans]GGA42115.1 hypothetical protein GCM10011328_16440 [Hafnia psychrotolerans]